MWIKTAQHSIQWDTKKADVMKKMKWVCWCCYDGWSSSMNHSVIKMTRWHMTTCHRYDSRESELRWGDSIWSSISLITRFMAPTCGPHENCYLGCFLFFGWSNEHERGRLIIVRYLSRIYPQYTFHSSPVSSKSALRSTISPIWHPNRPLPQIPQYTCPISNNTPAQHPTMHHL